MTSQKGSERYKDIVIKIVHFLKQSKLYLPLHFTKPNSVLGKLEEWERFFFLFLRQDKFPLR